MANGWLTTGGWLTKAAIGQHRCGAEPRDDVALQVHRFARVDGGGHWLLLRLWWCDVHYTRVGVGVNPFPK